MGGGKPVAAQRELQAAKLLIIDELADLPLSPTGAELPFEVFSQRCEHGSCIVIPTSRCKRPLV